MIFNIISNIFSLIFFSSFTTSFKESLRKFNEIFLYLAFDSGSNSGSNYVSNSGSSFGSKCFVENTLFIKLLNFFSLNHMLVRNNYFSINFLPLSLFSAKFFCSSSASFRDKFFFKNVKNIH